MHSISWIKEIYHCILDDEECLECEAVLEALEEIDDEADMYGIDFVKSDDEHTAKTVGGVFSTPALVYFRKGNPLVYDGKFSFKIFVSWNSENTFFQNYL